MAPILIPLSFLAFISLGLPDGLLGVAWPSMSAEFALPIESLGVMVAAYTAGYLVSSFLGGALIRALATGTLLWTMTALASAGLFAYAAAPVWPALLLAAATAGFAGGAIDAALNAYGARHFSARILNWLHAFFGVGTTLGPLIVTVVLSASLSWRWSFALVGAAQLALAFTFLATRNIWGRPPAEAAPATTLSTLALPQVWLAMATFAIYCGAEISAAQWSYTLLTEGRGVAEVTAGLYVTLYWGSLTAGRVIFGIVADKVPLEGALRTAIAASLMGSLIFALSPLPALWPVGLAIMGFAFAPIFASLVSLTPGKVGAAHADSAVGFEVASASVGAAAFIALIGLGVEAAGLEVIGISFVVLCAALFVVFEAFMRVKPPAPAAA